MITCLDGKTDTGRKIHQMPRSQATVKNALRAIPHDSSSVCAKVGMALANEYGVDGRELFTDWCDGRSCPAGDPSHDLTSGSLYDFYVGVTFQEDTQKDTGRRKATIRSIFWLAKEAQRN